MIRGLPLARWVARMCAVLVLASSAYTANALAEKYLHANAMVHPPSILAGLAHDHDGSETADNHHVDHHEADDHHTDNGRHGGGERDGGDTSHDGGVRHHHHADLNVDAVHLDDHRVGSSTQPREAVEIDPTNAAVSMLSWGIERPPRP